MKAQNTSFSNIAEHKLKRRKLISGLSGLSILGTTAPSIWVKPIVNVIVLPSHAQTSIIDDISESVISCSATGMGLSEENEAITEGTFISEVILTISTTPPEPGGLINLQNLCNGEVDSQDQQYTLDQLGQYILSVNQSICPSDSATYGVRITLQSNDSTTECNYGVVSEGLG